MTRSKVVIAFACIGLALGGCGSKAPGKTAPAPAPAAAPQASVPMVEVTANSLNIRETASTTGAVVGTLKRGDRARAPEAEAGGWLYVEVPAGPTGYVASKYVRAVEESAASAPAPAAASAPASGETSARPPPPGSKLARVTNGMSEAQVVEILGPPTSQQNYQTGKAWIPYYYGPDTGRLDYRYKGLGSVVFSRNRYSGGTKVVRVDSDPNEDGYP
jgi:Bacterial SH3 domain/SmpA / OmlA family